MPGTFFEHITNSIFWNNYPSSIDTSGTGLVVSYSNIDGGFAGLGNIDADPKFITSLRDNFKIRLDSPCIDAANGNVALPVDILGNYRVDILDVSNTGVGSPDYVDMGAYERQ